MPVSREILSRLDAAIDNHLRRDNENTEPKHFLEEERYQPIAEPPTMPQEDSAPQRIHGAGRKDLFK